MAFGNIAGRAGFVIDLDKSQLDRGLPEAERQFQRATSGMAASATRAGDAIGGGRGGAAGVGLVGRLGLIGGAVTAAAQAGQHLDRWLRSVDQQATSTSGRLAGVTAELKSLDFVGALGKASAAPKTLEELGIAAKDAEGALDGLKQAADVFGGSWRQVYTEAYESARAFREQATAMREVLNASLGLADAQGRRVPGQFGLDLQPLEAGAQIGRRPASPFTSAPGLIREQNLREAQRDEDLRRQREIREQQVRIAEGRLRAVRDKASELFRKRATEVEDARDALDSVRDQIRAAEQADREQAAQRAREREAERERAEAERASALRAGFGTREQTLRNQYGEALLTPGRRDDRRTASTLSAFLGGTSRDQRLDAGERADFRSRQIAFLGERKRDREALAKAAMDDTREELRLQEQVLLNNVKAAELTEKNKRDDIRENRRLRDFYRRAERESTGLERQGFRSDRLDTQKKLNELLGKGSGSSDQLDELAKAYHQIAVDFMDTIRNSFSTVVGGTGAGNSLQTHVLEQWTAQGNSERQRQTRILERIAGSRQQRLADEGLMA